EVDRQSEVGALITGNVQRVPKESIRAAASVQNVSPVTVLKEIADEGVVSVAAGKIVIAVQSRYAIISSATVKKIVSGTTYYSIVATQSHDRNRFGATIAYQVPVIRVIAFRQRDPGHGALPEFSLPGGPILRTASASE